MQDLFRESVQEGRPTSHTRVVVAHLGDIVRSKEAAGREKDRLTLPTLRRLLARLERQGP